MSVPTSVTSLLIRKAIKNTPNKLRVFQACCLLVLIIFSGIAYTSYSEIRGMYQTLGFDTVPSITAACDIRSLLADANSNAINTFLAQDLDPTSFWKSYEKEITESQ